MSIRNVLGFKSKFVLHKLGFDLRGTLRGTVEAPIPDELVEKAEAIPNQEPDRDVIVLHRSQYRTLGYDNLA